MTRPPDDPSARLLPRRLGRHVRVGNPRGDAGHLAADVEALAQVVDAGRGRLDATALAQAETVVGRISERARLSGEHTVVALAGATGSGKSSLFNALSGVAVAQVGVRRPTTSDTMAIVWGLDTAHALLDWLEVSRRHRVEHASALSPTGGPSLGGLVLLDLPDHDSTVAAHRIEVDRLVGLVDMLIWVLDPQKYADAVVHANYLRTLTAHRDVMVIVLNQADRLSDGNLAACLADLHRLLVADGLTGVPVIATSSVTGRGLPALRNLLGDLVPRKRIAADRADADVLAAARAFGSNAVGVETPRIDPAVRSELAIGLGVAAGADLVAAAVERSFRRQSAKASGWPLTSWLVRSGVEPVRPLRPAGGVNPVGATSIPPRSPGMRARADVAVRELIESTGGPLPRPWQRAVESAAGDPQGRLTDSLDAAVAGTDLGSGHAPRWWAVLRASAWAVFVVAAGGALWLLALAFASRIRLPDTARPHWAGLPVPAVLLVGGLVLGVVIAVVGRIGGVVGGRRRAELARRRIGESVSQVADELIVEPVEHVLIEHERCRIALTVLLR